MGVDLNMLPKYIDNKSLDVLSFDRDSDLFELIEGAIEKLGVDVPRDGISCYMGRNEFSGESQFDLGVEYDYYDNRIKGLRPKEFLSAINGIKIDGWKNKAIIEFVKQMPEDGEIWFFWH